MAILFMFLMPIGMSGVRPAAQSVWKRPLLKEKKPHQPFGCGALYCNRAIVLVAVYAMNARASGLFDLNF
jgi:hypothetical protein